MSSVMEREWLEGLERFSFSEERLKVVAAMLPGSFMRLFFEGMRRNLLSCHGILPHSSLSRTIALFVYPVLSILGY